MPKLASMHISNRLIILFVFITPLSGCQMMGSIFFHTDGSSLSFQSSDGKWADSEDHWKGRNFKSIVFYFELYKIHCNVSDVRLERTEKKPSWYTFTNKFNDYTDIKWRVPYATPLLQGKNIRYYPPVYENVCNNKGTSNTEYEQAKENSEKFLSFLKSLPVGKIE